MQGLVTVFGGSGFVGSQIVRALAKEGWRIRVAVRQVGRGYRLRMLGDVGQVEIVQANIRDEASTARALEGADGLRQRGGRALRGRAARASTPSTRRARERSPTLAARGGRQPASCRSPPSAPTPTAPSAYARSKAAGEAAVRAAFPDATILRPSIVFGPEDHFFNRFAAMAGALAGPAADRRRPDPLPAGVRRRRGRRGRPRRCDRTQRRADLRARRPRRLHLQGS